MSQLAAKGMMPDALANKPEVSHWVSDIFEMFILLNSSRASSMGIAGIPASEVLAYFQIFGITDPDERLRSMQLLHRLDAVYMKRMHEKQEQQRKNPHPKRGWR